MYTAALQQQRLIVTPNLWTAIRRRDVRTQPVGQQASQPITITSTENKQTLPWLMINGLRVWSVMRYWETTLYEHGMEYVTSVSFYKNDIFMMHAEIFVWQID